jgi:hypothetical protein
MPFEAAKAIAATFCWKIRYALTPIFGTHFPQTCLTPESEEYGAMVIDPAIIQRCTEQASFYRELEVRSSSLTRSLTRSPFTPESPIFPRQIKQLRPRARRVAESESEYSSDASGEDNNVTAFASSTSSHSINWTPANTPRSVGPLRRECLPSPRQILAGNLTEAAEAEDTEHCYSDSASTSSTVSLLLKSGGVVKDDGQCDPDDGHSSRTLPRISKADESREKVSEDPYLSEKKAAYLLLKLSMETRLNEQAAPKSDKRRASA